jgi:hypothetical protein
MGQNMGIIPGRRVSEGFHQALRNTQKLNPSLTQRVGIVANAQLQKASARDLGGRTVRTRNRNSSLTFRHQINILI